LSISRFLGNEKTIEHLSTVPRKNHAVRAGMVLYHPFTSQNTIDFFVVVGANEK